MSTATKLSTIRRQTALEPERQDRPARATYRYLRMRGFSSIEAGNVAAMLVGLRPDQHGWTPAEIVQLLFLRWEFRSGRLES